jgi:hypothetical protein
MSVKIVFRGLLVFNEVNGAMEIGALYHPHGTGVLHDPHHAVHIPRIITTRNGVITSVFDLRTRPELQPPGEPGHVRNWRISVTNPVKPNVDTFTVGPVFDRQNGQNHPRDYRWLTHLDGDDLHGNIADLQTNKLTMVLTVPTGEFYTDQLSRPLLRKRMANGLEEVYGKAAEVTACDIRTTGGPGTDEGVQLTVNGNIVFKFKGRSEDGVVYEFSNAPPDVLPHRVYSPNEPGHFIQYHNLFGQGNPVDRYDLIPELDLAPAPDPALCGAARVTPRPDGF